MMWGIANTRVHAPRLHAPSVAFPRPILRCNAATLSTEQRQSVADIKDALLFTLASTSRGASVSKIQRGIIEEAQIALESYGTAIDYDMLPGTWELLYTTAPDVLPLVAPSPTIPFVPRVGPICQRFTALDAQGVGRVENVIKLSIPGLLVPDDGVTITVGARYEPRGLRNILLFFEDFGLGNVNISQQLQAALAPAMLPRSWINQQVLLALKEFRLRIPLNTRPLDGRNVEQRRRQGAAGYYLLTYLDEQVLVGRQQAGGGTFVFRRVQDL